MSDAYVQIAPDSTGKKIATNEITRDNGDVVAVQQISLVDSRLTDTQVKINNNGELIVYASTFSDIVAQLKRIAMLLEIITHTNIPVDSFYDRD